MEQLAYEQTPFGALLRSWRSARRLSQLELSLISNVSQRHLSFLESGRGRPSRQMIFQLAGALDIPLREQNDLLQAAGFATAFRCSPLDTRAMEPVRQALEMVLAHHDPYPAIVVDRDWNLLMANQGMNTLLALAGEQESLWQRTCGDGPRNIMRLCLHPQGLRPLIGNWEVAAPPIMARLLREQTTAPSEGISSLLSMLREDDSIPLRWHQPEPSQQLAPVLALELVVGDHRLNLFSMISTFGTPQDVTTDELRVETSFPADTASASLLRELAAHSRAGA